MKIAWDEVWTDAVALLRANRAAVVPIAAALLFLPALLTSYFLPFPREEDPARLVAAYGEHLQANGHWMLLANIVGMVGALAFLFIVLRGRGQTVGAVLVEAGRLLPFYFVATLIWSLLMTLALIVGSLMAGLLQLVLGSGLGAVILGMALLLVPLSYVYGRTALYGAAMVAEAQRNPFAALVRAVRLTAGAGWAVTGLVAIVFVVGFILIAAVTAVTGLALIQLAGDDIGRLIAGVIAAALTAALYTLMAFLHAAIYRALAGPPAAPDRTGSV